MKIDESNYSVHKRIEVKYFSFSFFEGTKHSLQVSEFYTLYSFATLIGEILIIQTFCVYIQLKYQRFTT